MDAKSKANFINSVASGQKVPCPQCNFLNDSGDTCCAACGTRLTKPAQPAAEPAPAVPAAPEAPVSPAPVIEEDPGIFAKGMPEWDIVPPEVAVRRKRR